MCELERVLQEFDGFFCTLSVTNDVVTYVTHIVTYGAVLL